MLFAVILPITIILIVSFVAFKRSVGAVSSMGLQQDESDETKKTFEILEINVPKQDDRADLHFSSFASEQLFAALHGLLREDPKVQEFISFEIKATELGIKFYVVAPLEIVKFVESQIYSQYPKAQLRIVEDYAKEEFVSNNTVKVGELAQTKEYFFPIKVFRDFEVDPLSSMLSTLGEVRTGDGYWVQFLVKPMPDGWQEPGHKYMSVLKEMGTTASPAFAKNLRNAIAKEIGEIGNSMYKHLMFGEPVVAEHYRAPPAKPPQLSAFQEIELELIESKLSKMGYMVVVRVVSYSGEPSRVESNLRSVGATFSQYKTSSSNALVLNESSNQEASIKRYLNREFDNNAAVILNSEELATIFHLPTSPARTANVSWVASKSGEPPVNLPVDDCTYIGETIFRGKKVRFGIKDGDDRLRHMYLIGKSGTGKSTLFETMVSQDIAKGHGVGVLDPHGETIDKILQRIPDHRVDDVVIFDPSDTQCPVGLNLLELSDPEQKNLMASGLLSAIKHHFDYSWGPRLEYLLNYALLTLIDVPGTTMLGITRLLEDANYQNYILHFVKDPVVKRFWESEFKEMRGNQKLVTEAIAPIQNKVNRFLASTTIRNILGQRRSTIDIWDIMNSKKILLMNLSKGKIGADNANLLGALLVSRIQFMALQRARLAPEDRQPFYLYVDEFQNFATGSFEEILSESRKYKLGLYLTHQYTDQLPEQLLKAVYGNVGTIATFALGAMDARELANEFAPYFDEEDIISLERFHVYIKLMMEGMTSLPFSAKILLPWVEETEIVPRTSNKEVVLAKSREKYGVDRERVEDIISRWVSRPFDKGMAIAEENRANAKQGGE